MRSFIRFALVGVVNTGLHTIVLWGLAKLGVFYTVASGIGFLVASIFSYVVNCRWTFKQAYSMESACRFLFANSSVLVWSLAVALAADRGYFGTTVVIILTAAVGPTINFLVHKLWTFRA
ncbi:GtrA family protein [Ralstonia mannitolilytica]|uniref:GtrA family protein n=1 Tax=Ralstonia mannitolilytica TaxID=105219 RepID=UPI003744809B